MFYAQRFNDGINFCIFNWNVIKHPLMIDFYYITSDTTPSEIEPHVSQQDDYKLGRIKKEKFKQTEDSLLELSDNLVNAENYYRGENIDACLK